MKFYAAYLLTISCFGILRHMKLCRDIIYQFVNPVHRCVYAHLTNIYEYSFEHFFPSVNTQTCVCINICEFCSSFKSFMCLRCRHICVVTCTLRCSNKSTWTGKKTGRNCSLVYWAKLWAFLMGECLCPTRHLANTAGSAPATATDLHPLSFWSSRPKADIQRKDATEKLEGLQCSRQHTEARDCSA